MAHLQEPREERGEEEEGGEEEREEMLTAHTHFHTYVLTALLLGNHAFCRSDEDV